MRETITMTSREQQRAQVLTRLLVGDVTAAEAATPARAVGAAGLAPAGRVRAGRARPPSSTATGAGPRRGGSTRRLAERILELARTTYDGANDCHLAELLAEHEGIAIGRSSLRRLLRARGPAEPATAPGAAAPQPAGPDAPGGDAPPGRRQPARLARGPRSAPDPGRRDRRRDRAPDRGDVPRAGGHRGLSRRAPRHGPPARHPARRVPRPHTACSRRRGARS